MICLENFGFTSFQEVGGGKEDLVALMGGEPCQLTGGPACGLHLSCNGFLVSRFRCAGHWLPLLRGSGNFRDARVRHACFRRKRVSLQAAGCRTLLSLYR